MSAAMRSSCRTAAGARRSNNVAVAAPMRPAAAAAAVRAPSRSGCSCNRVSARQQQPSWVARAAFEPAKGQGAPAGVPGKAAAAKEPTVEEIMNPHPVLLRADMPIKEAVHALLDADVSGAPVVDADGRLVGVLSEKDVIWKGAGAPDDHFIIPPVFVGALEATLFLRDNAAFEAEAKKILARTVAEAMAKGRLVAVAPATPMAEAARLMLHHDVNLLPVAEAGRVVGVVTRHDVLRGLYASESPFL